MSGVCVSLAVVMAARVLYSCHLTVPVFLEAMMRTAWDTEVGFGCHFEQHRGAERLWDMLCAFAGWCFKRCVAAGRCACACCWCTVGALWMSIWGRLRNAKRGATAPSGCSATSMPSRQTVAYYFGAAGPCNGPGGDFCAQLHAGANPLFYVFRQTRTAGWLMLSQPHGSLELQIWLHRWSCSLSHTDFSRIFCGLLCCGACWLAASFQCPGDALPWQHDSSPAFSPNSTLHGLQLL